ncbi:Ribosome biogenesis protein nsa1 (NOP7-associated protein 1) [Dispira parvispora]|uniref:Ribosome biogenesis protein NSA1 n=1 Tax=Dispira parvispora TaxID=1520584 RepID=A0A9W8AUX5_9FUNG|nr:Ribosome biogenesis protein nsa1 (NOP7-associated protein 1) [Dispira parvispora]
MQLLTGDEAGLVKAVTVAVDDRRTKAFDTKVPLTRRHLLYGSRDKKDASESNDIIKLWQRQVNRSRGVQKMTLVTPNNTTKNDTATSLLLVARANGDIEWIDTDWARADPTPSDEQQDAQDTQGKREPLYTAHQAIFDNNASLRGNQVTQAQKFIGLWGNQDGRVAYLTSQGNFSLQSVPLHTLSTSPADVDPALNLADPSSLYLNFGKDLSCMRIHQTSTTALVGLVGRERQLTLWDMQQLSSTTTGSNLANDTAQPSWATPQGEPYFKAKNVPHDNLGLRVPYWGTDFEFMNSEGTQLVLGTEQHQIRLYDTKASRSPVADFTIGKHPLRRIVLSPDQNYLYAADNVNLVHQIDLRMRRTVGSLKGATGAVADMAILPGDSSHMVSVGLDRFLRVHHIGAPGLPLVHSVYLKQRMSQVLPLGQAGDLTQIHSKESSNNGNPKGDSNSEGDDDDDLWNTMATVIDKPRSKRRRVKN